MAKLKKLQKNNKALISLLIIIVVLGAIVFTARNQSSKTRVEVIVPHEGTVVFVDETRRTETRTNDQAVTLHLAPGEHQILLGHDDRFPYLKEIVVEEGEERLIEPFMYPQTGQARNISDETLVAEIQKNTLPTRRSPIVSDSGNLSLWVENTIVFADWTGAEENQPSYICQGEECGGGTTVYAHEKAIHGASFFPNRDDRVVVATEDTIYIIEVARSENQNIQPLYQGPFTGFTATNDRLYVLEQDNNLIEIEL